MTLVQHAWELEEALWAAAATGEVNNYYANTLTEQATVVGAGYRLRRADVIDRCSHDGVRLSEYTLSDRKTLLCNDSTQILTYRILARGPDLPADYSAQISSVYLRTDDGWSLALRQHTPDPSGLAGQPPAPRPNVSVWTSPTT